MERSETLTQRTIIYITDQNFNTTIKEIITSNLHSQGFKHIFFLSPSDSKSNSKKLDDLKTQHHFDYFLLLNNQSHTTFDLNYFLISSSLHYSDQTAQLQEYKILENNFANSDQYDTYTDCNIFYTNKLATTTSCNKIPSPTINLQSPRTPALFLDRDGVINEDTSYLHKPSAVILKEKIVTLIKLANQRSWPVFVLTNQSGVARGKFTEEDVIFINNYIKDILSAEGASISEFIYSPFYFEKATIDKYKKRSLLRKPNAGMLLNIVKNYNIDLFRSFMVGDKVSDDLDIQGVTTLLIKGRYDLSSFENKSNIFSSLSDIAKFLK